MTNVNLIELPLDNGGKINVSSDGDEFIVEAARTKPHEPWENAKRIIGSGIKQVWLHPTDVAMVYATLAAEKGAFNRWNSNAQQQARVAFWLVNQNTMISPADFRLEVQLMLLYYQADVRGKLLTDFGTRFTAGGFASATIYSLGGRLTKGSVTSKVVLLAHNFIASAYGAMLRVSIKYIQWLDSKGYKINPNNVDTYLIGSGTMLNAALTGSDDFIHLPHELGTSEYYELREYLREHPEAIQIEDAELELLNQFFIFLEKWRVEGNQVLIDLFNERD